MVDVRKVLVLGPGSREHAIVKTLQRTSKQPIEVYFSPGNSGVSDRYRHNIDIMNFKAVCDLSQAININLVVPGPEAPLCAGIVDYFGEHAPNIPIFGPCRAAARLEKYKAVMKCLCSRYGIQTADYRIVHTKIDADDAVEEFGLPVVLKANGLCGGKGVVVAKTLAEADQAIDEALRLHRFGDEGHTLVIEKFIPGREVSAMRFCDGLRAIRMPIARDYKRLKDGDEGSNTGGMGAFSPVPDIENDPALMAKIDEVFAKLLDAMRHELSPYHGVLYCGFMVTPDDELYLLECNVRFGDPETQVVLPILQSDLAEIMLASCTYGGLANIAEPRWSNKVAVGVVVANEGYPDTVTDHFHDLTGVGEAMQVADELFFGSTFRDQHGIYHVTSGRMLTVVGIGDTHADARDRSYNAARLIKPGRMRNDIAFGI